MNEIQLRIEIIFKVLQISPHFICNDLVESVNYLHSWLFRLFRKLQTMTIYDL